jgi:hypothetical protein
VTSAPNDRGLAAILSADVVGYSRLKEWGRASVPSDVP